MLCAIPPSWALPQAKYDLDFANGRYWGCGTVAINRLASNLIQGLITGPENGVAGFAPNGQGVLVPFSAYDARIAPGTGLWVEYATTNNALWCRDFTNVVWTKVTVTAAHNQVGADAKANSASLLTATSILGTALQTITLASSQVISSAYVKRVTGAGTISMSQDGTTWTDITSQINSNTFTKVQIAPQTLLNPVVGFQISTSGDAIAVDMFQTEGGASTTTPLVTTSATNSRFIEECVFGNLTGNINAGQRILDDVFANGSPYSVLMIGSGSPSGTKPQGYWLPSDGNTAMIGGCDGSTCSFNGNSGSGGTLTGAITANNGTAGLGNINKVCGRINGSTNSVCMNGGAIATNTASPPIRTKFTHSGLIGGGDGVSPINGYLSRMVIWAKEITDGQMIEYTR